MNFVSFTGVSVQGMVLADNDDIIKNYRSRIQADKAAAKIQTKGIACKVLVNGRWQRSGKPKGFAIVQL